MDELSKEQRIAELSETIREARALGNLAEVRELEAIMRAIK